MITANATAGEHHQVQRKKNTYGVKRDRGCVKYTPVYYTPSHFYTLHTSKDNPCPHRMHVDQPAGFFSRVLHALEAVASIHFISELAALEPLDSGQIRHVIPMGKEKGFYYQ